MQPSLAFHSPGSTQPPTIGLWLRRVEELSRMEDLVLTSRQKRETYTHTWTLWNMFIYSEEGKALIEVTPNG